MVMVPPVEMMAGGKGVQDAYNGLDGAERQCSWPLARRW